MFYLVGIGLKPRHLTLEAKEIIANCSEVYLETYTSVYGEGKIVELSGILRKKLVLLDRNEVEEKFGKVLKSAKKKDVALLVFGNALSATTHVQILLDAKKAGVKYRVLPGISIVNFLGNTGLSEYKFGRTTTIVLPEKDYEPESFYDVIVENKRMGLHTLCLLDIKGTGERLMEISEGLEILEKIEAHRNKSVLKNSTIVGIANAGSKNEKIVAGKIGKVKNAKLGTPASLIVCGELSDKESEALKKLGK